MSAIVNFINIEGASEASKRKAVELATSFIYGATITTKATGTKLPIDLTGSSFSFKIFNAAGDEVADWNTTAGTPKWEIDDAVNGHHKSLAGPADVDVVGVGEFTYTFTWTDGAGDVRRMHEGEFHIIA